MARAAGILLFAVVLAACAEFRWYKAGTDDVALAQDLSACSKLASERSSRMGSMAPQTSIDPRLGPMGGPSPAELRLQESQAINVCMREKGYALVPKSEAAGK